MAGIVRKFTRVVAVLKGAWWAWICRLIQENTKDTKKGKSTKEEIDAIDRTFISKPSVHSI